MSDTTATCTRCEKTHVPQKYEKQIPPAYAGWCDLCLPWNLTGKNKCIKCKQKKLRDNFKRVFRGRLSNICNDCRLVPADGTTRCVRCKQRFPTKSYPLTVGGRFSVYCAACSLPKRTQYTCIQCRHKLPVAEFGQNRSGYRQKTCLQCTGQNRTTRRCVGCAQTSPIENYPLTSTGCRRRYCASCHAKRRARDVIGRLSLYPCVECQGPVYTTDHNRPNAKKFCSVECARSAATLKERECIYCGVTKRTEEFDRKRCGVGFRATCKACDTLRGTGRLAKRNGAMTPKQMVLYAGRRAADLGFTEKVTLRHVLRIIDLGCGLCGSETVALGFKAARDKGLAHALVPVCRYCQRMLTWRTFEELQAWAVAVAQGAPDDVLVPHRLRRKKKSNYVKKADREAPDPAI